MTQDTTAAATEALPTWDLSDLYAGIDDPNLQTDFDRIRQQAADFAATYKGSIDADDLDPAHLRSAVDAYEALIRDQYKPQAYAQLLFSINTGDAARGALLQKAQEFGSAVSTQLVFFELEIGRMPKAAFQRASADPTLAPYRHFLQQVRDQAKHNLTEPEEKILVETSNARGTAFGRLFTEIQGRTRYAVDGKDLAQEELLALLYSPQRETRQKAATALTAGLQKNAHTCTFIYNTLLHEKDVLDRLRAYERPESSRHLANELDPEVVDTMVDVCVANYGIVADYYDLKRRMLGLDELTHYDRYAPLQKKTQDIPFGQAKATVLDAFGEFSPKLAQLTEPFFSRGWIDAALTEGKRGGAFCAGITPDLHPYVLMNYTRQPRDVMTLAHELGHGVHDVLAARNHLFDYHPVLPMAETASTFGEMLVFDRLQRTIQDDDERLALLCGRIEDTFATVFRQVAMFRFECQAHQARRQEGELPTARFSQLWQENMQQMFGDALKLGDEHACWWLYIPHIVHTPFYVYAYAFGELLVLSLYARYRQEGEDFVERYFELLAAGGSKRPADLVAAMGLDIGSRDFWQAGCDLIRQRVADARQLAG